MESRLTRPVIVGLSLSLIVILGQVLAIGAIVNDAVHQFWSPTDPRWMTPFLHHAEVFRGEIYYSSLDGSGALSRLRAFNLKSGGVREIDMPDLFGNPMLTATNDRLWALGTNCVYETDGQTVTTHLPQNSLQKMFTGGSVRPVSRAFNFEGQMALAVQNKEGACHILSLDHDQWKDHGEVLIPGNKFRWVPNETTGQYELALRPGLKGDDLPQTIFHLTILTVRGRPHLFAKQVEFLSSTPGHTRLAGIAYRAGFDFVPQNVDGAGDRNPIDGNPELTGWSTLALDASISTTPGHTRVFAINEELFIADHRAIYRLRRPDQNQSTMETELVFQSDDSRKLDFVATSSTDADAAYFLGTNPTSDVEVFHFDGRQLTKLPSVINGRIVERKWLAVATIWKTLGVLFGGNLLLVFVTMILDRRQHYSFGSQTAFLSSVMRRSVARAIDVALMISPLCIWFILQTSSPSIRTLFDFSVHSDLLIGGVAWLILSWTVMTLGLGLTGATPGKWLCQIRVVQSTLRPCGLKRAILRELLFWVDAPQLLTVAPGTVSVIVTSNRQRIGDFIADTIVTRADSGQRPSGETLIKLP